MSLLQHVASETANPIARKRAELKAAGLELIDLTDSNPTRHELFDPRILDIIADHLPQAGRYDPNPRGPWPARAALAERFGGGPEDYWLTASTSEAYGWLFSLLADPGDTVAIPAPGYPLIEPLARLHHVKTRAYRTFYMHPSGWELDRPSLEAIIATPGTRAVVAVNPNNPTGAYTESDLVDAVAQAGLPLIADEVFFPFRLADSGAAGPPCEDDHRGQRRTEGAPDADLPLVGFAPAATCPTDPSPAHPSPADPSPAHSSPASTRQTDTSPPASRLAGTESTLTFGLDGLSKLLAAPQLKLGWIRLSGPRAQQARAEQALDEIADSYLSVNSPVALALPDLLTLADSTIVRVTDRLRRNLATARTIFPDFRIRTVYGGWMMVLDVPPIMEADALGVALMERAGLYAHPGYFYDLPDSALTISLLPRPDVFEQSCHLLLAALTVFMNE
ncbi:MAG: pyridoxal phosphate-dependent aminotransferase [Propionibacteriaceae bacterium]|nr:pyridoxal phosphate-dependent aminotransferase [Propionibacteriaceae bacterium]